MVVLRQVAMVDASDDEDDEDDEDDDGDDAKVGGKGGNALTSSDVKTAALPPSSDLLQQRLHAFEQHIGSIRAQVESAVEHAPDIMAIGDDANDDDTLGTSGSVSGANIGNESGDENPGVMSSDESDVPMVHDSPASSDGGGDDNGPGIVDDGSAGKNIHHLVDDENVEEEVKRVVEARKAYNNTVTQELKPELTSTAGRPPSAAGNGMKAASAASHEYHHGPIMEIARRGCVGC